MLRLPPRSSLFPFTTLFLSVAVIENVPVFENMTPCELMIPFVKPPAVPPPDTIVPDDVIPTVPPKPGTVFPNVSRAVIFMENGTPAACAGMLPQGREGKRRRSRWPADPEIDTEALTAIVPDL